MQGRKIGVYVAPWRGLCAAVAGDISSGIGVKGRCNRGRRWAARRQDGDGDGDHAQELPENWHATLRKPGFHNMEKSGKHNIDTNIYI